MSKPRITYSARANATPDAELDTLAAVYRFVLDCHAKRKGARPGAHERPERIKDDPARIIIPEHP